MTIHTPGDELIPLRDACRLIPRTGGRTVHVSALYRWSRHGLRGVTLDAVQVGGTLCTSRAALGRFFAALTAARAGRPTPPPADPARAAAHGVGRQLDALGL